MASRNSSGPASTGKAPPTPAEDTTEKMDTTPANSTGTASNANASDTKRTPNPMLKIVSSQGYRDMTQVVKKLNQKIEKLQEEIADLQIRWADTTFLAAILFDPEVGQIISNTQLMSITNDELPPQANLSEELKAKVRAQAELRFAALKQEENRLVKKLNGPEQVNMHYDQMSQQLEKSVNVFKK